MNCPNLSMPLIVQKPVRWLVVDDFHKIIVIDGVEATGFEQIVAFIGELRWLIIICAEI